MRHLTLHIVLFLTFCLAACKQKSQSVVRTKDEKPKADSIVLNTKVSLELSIPSTDAGRFLFLNCENNEVSVILRNSSDSAVRFYETNNSWGYQNYIFIIKTKDTSYFVTKAETGFGKNIPTFHTIFPHETLVLHFNIKDTECEFQFTETGQLKRKVLRSNKDGWEGLPDNPIEKATIQVLYKLSNSDKDFKPFGASIFSDTLLSNVLKISIEK